MIGALKGTIIPSVRNPITVFVGGVGYAVNIPERLLSKPPGGGETMLYIHTHVRDDAIELFGFETPEDLDLFNLLLTVPGIGPKTALGVTDKGSSAIRTAVQQSDIDFFTTVPRLGRKNAQKIIIELTNKMGTVRELDLSPASDKETKELMDALVDMGFSRAKVTDIIKRLPPTDITLEAKLRHALRLLG